MSSSVEEPEGVGDDPGVGHEPGLDPDGEEDGLSDVALPEGAPKVKGTWEGGSWLGSFCGFLLNLRFFVLLDNFLSEIFGSLGLVLSEIFL